MNADERKKISVIAEYVRETFTADDWYTLGQLTGRFERVTNHHRLLQSLHFGDDDYPANIIEVLTKVFDGNEGEIENIINYYDIDLWYKQKSPTRYVKIFDINQTISSDVWKTNYFRVFLSHISKNKVKIASLKEAMYHWGISAFVAHEDIEPSREWREEVEAALFTMDYMVAVVEPGFKESDWCPQEVGIALGRRVEILPLKLDMDPFGFFGKFQAINIRGKFPSTVAEEVVSVILRKPALRDKILRAIQAALSISISDLKVKQVIALDTMAILPAESMKSLIEGIGLSDHEKKNLKSIIDRVGAFADVNFATAIDDDIPF